MGNYQYCERCSAGLNPTPNDIIEGEIICEVCDTISEIAYQESALKTLLKEMYEDIQTLKSNLGDIQNGLK